MRIVCQNRTGTRALRKSVIDQIDWLDEILRKGFNEFWFYRGIDMDHFHKLLKHVVHRILEDEEVSI